MCFIFPLRSAMAATELVGSWDFEESGGDAILDQSSYSNNGVLSGASRSTGYAGQGLYLDGSGGVIIPHSVSLDQMPGGLTLESWIKPTEFGDFTTIFYKTNPAVTPREFLHFQTGNHDGHLHIGFNTDPFTWTTSDAVIELNKWQHVAWTYDESFQRIYVNGNEVFNTPFTDPFNGNTAPLYIGQNPYIPASNFVGFIDSARIYHGALSSEEILTHATVTPEPSSMILFGLGVAALLVSARFRLIPE